MTRRLLHNGGVSAKGHAVTKDGGSFKVERTMIDAVRLSLLDPQPFVHVLGDRFNYWDDDVDHERFFAGWPDIVQPELVVLYVLSSQRDRLRSTYLAQG